MPAIVYKEESKMNGLGSGVPAGTSCISFPMVNALACRSIVIGRWLGRPIFKHSVLLRNEALCLACQRIPDPPFLSLITQVGIRVNERNRLALPRPSKRITRINFYYFTSVHYI